MMRSPVRLGLGLLASFFVGHGALGQCWTSGPASSAQSQDSYPVASTVWDPDGAGSAPPYLVIGQPGELTTVLAWSGSEWFTMGLPFNGSIYDLEVYDGKLYACGDFSQVGAAQANGIARWNGGAWERVGQGLGTIQGAGAGTVRAMFVFNNVLYVGGHFQMPGVEDYGTCAAWVDIGSGEWVSVPQIDGEYGEITSFCNYGGQMYAGVEASFFHTNGGVYRYDSNSWTQVGDTGTDDGVETVCAYNSRLVAGGDFSQINGVGASRIAWWNGTTWAPMASGVSPATLYNRVITMKVYNSSLIVGGHFGYMNGQPMTKVARWDGISWNAMGSGIPFIWPDPPPVPLDAVWALEVFNNELVAMGAFSRAGNYAANDIARWNGTDWLPFTEGINGRVRTFLAAGSTLYAGGEFDFTKNGSEYNHVLSTDGTNLNPLETPTGGFTGVNGLVNALSLHTFNIVQPPKLIIGGSFATAAGLPIANIASYSFLSGYAQLGSGFNGAVSALADYQGAIYAAGTFTASGATALPHLAKFTTSGWVSPGNWSFSTIQALAVSNGKLIIGSVYNLGSGTDGVSSWDGTTLATLGTANGLVRAITTYNGDLIVGGSFTQIGGVSANGIARRDSATGQWVSLGAGFSQGAVFALAVHENQLYAGGSFVSSNGAPLYRIGRWTGTSWAPVATGTDGPVYAMASFGGRLHVGGEFNQSLTPRVMPYWGEYTCGCYANCDGSAASPTLNVNDFICFQARFAAGDPYANCDGSTAPPTLNVNDFICFQTKFASGCP